MSYVAAKGGEAAIDAAHRLLEKRRRGDVGTPSLTIAQIREQLALSVDRVASEGGVYDPDLAALAIKQAWGDLVEAIFLLRAFRTTLSRVAESVPLDAGRMRVERRISATFKDLPGGQRLGATFDYTHRLLDFSLLEERDIATEDPPEAAPEADDMARVRDILGQEGLLEAAPAERGAPADITLDPLRYPAERDARLQALARGDEGFLLAMAYSTQRGYGNVHPFVAELRHGRVPLEIVPPELGFPIEIGEIPLTECEMVNQFKGSEAAPPQFTSGYGLALGGGERKAIAMALVDRALRAAELGEAGGAPAQDQEFVLGHLDNVEASGFIQHLKLPHYVDFQSELELLRHLRKVWPARKDTAE